MPTILDATLEESRAMLRVKRAEYQDAIAKIDEILVAMADTSGLVGPPQTGTVNDAPPRTHTRKRRRMSTQARAAVSRRMKKYWRGRRQGK